MGSNVCGGYVVVNISHHAVVSDESRNRFTISKLRFELADSLNWLTSLYTLYRTVD